jgi:pyruvate dehydrogenase E2 component (dihydrolipoamide acetyltransferase)
MAEFRMPSLGADMTEGILVKWLVKPGDRVKKRDIIAVVETDKAAIEVEVYETGIVEALLVEPGRKVPVGTVLALIRNTGAPRTVQAKPADTAAAPPPASAARVKASPYAGRLAAESGLSLADITGSGPGGAVTAADVNRATPQLPAQPGSTDQPAAMRRAIAAAMTRSKREIPHYYLQTRVELSRTSHWLSAINGQRPISQRLLPVIPLIRAVVLALAEVPELNGHWRDDRLVPAEAVHLGFAVSLRQGGLIAPAILNAEGKTPEQLMAALGDLINRARKGGLRSSEITDATISVTSLGELGVETVYGVIYPPQVALIGFGKTIEQPWAENGMLGVRPVLSVTLAADHRASDGHRGAQFLDALNHYLQEPEKL